MEIARVEAEWMSEKKQWPFRRPSHALTAMRRTAERLIASETYDENSGVARQIAEKEEEEARIAEQRIAEGKEAALACVRAEYESTRSAIVSEFQRRRKAARPQISRSAVAKPRIIAGQPEIIRPVSPCVRPGF
jgi:hypothetical protein